MYKILKTLKLLPATIMPKSFKQLESYPPRNERNDDNEYDYSRHILIDVEKLSCFWCDKTKEEAEAEGNYLETHHWAEQSLWNKFDVNKVYKDLKWLDFHGHAKDLPDNPNDLHVNHIANLVVSCSPCHRENGYGLHASTMPFVWARRWLKDKSDDVLKRYKPLRVRVKNAIKTVIKKKGE